MRVVLFSNQTRRARGPIAVDLGTHSVRMLQLAENTAGPPRVIAAGEHKLPHGISPLSRAYHDAARTAINAILGTARFRGRRVVSALPASVTHFKNLRLPQMPADELAQAVAWEARERGQFGNQEVEVRHLNAGEVRQGDQWRQEVILVAAPVAFTEAHVQTLLDCGLDPVALDVTPTALQRCLDLASNQTHEQASEDAAPVRIVLDVGYSASKVLIVRGGRVLFFKLLEVGGRKLDELVSQRLDMSPDDAAAARRANAAGATSASSAIADNEPDIFSPQSPTIEPDGDGDSAPAPEAGRAAATGAAAALATRIHDAIRPALAELTREVALCLRYYSVTFRSERPAELLVVGGEAEQAGLHALLTEDTGMPVAPMDPLASVELGAWSQWFEGGPGRLAWATAVGMARRHEVSNSQRRAA